MIYKSVYETLFLKFLFSTKLKKEGKVFGALNILKFARTKKIILLRIFFLNKFFFLFQDDNHSNLDLSCYEFKSNIAIVFSKFSVLVQKCFIKEYIKKNRTSQTYIFYMHIICYFFSVTPWRKIIVINELIIIVKVVWVSEHGTANSLVE